LASTRINIHFILLIGFLFLPILLVSAQRQAANKVPYHINSTD